MKLIPIVVVLLLSGCKSHQECGTDHRYIPGRCSHECLLAYTAGHFDRTEKLDMCLDDCPGSTITPRICK